MRPWRVFPARGVGEGKDSQMKLASRGASLVLPAALGLAVPPAAGSPVRLGGPARHDVAAAVVRAQDRLRQPACAAVLAAFEDPSGRRLSDVRSQHPGDEGDYLDRLLFYDGTGQPTCDQRGTVAFTSPGSRVVFVCPSQFVRLRRREPRQAEYIVIHEALHTLGLAENPPTSLEITRRVEEHCSP
jgi:hypothetical protein